ncbi:DUF2889 domain-containing protein [Novosphingobium panipatense]
MIAIAIEDVFALPGYRRTIRIEPGEGRVRAMLEDDLHAMAVQLWHARGVVTNVVPVMDRAPWTPCPGAQRVLIDTFTGLPLHQVSARFERQANCTHLHDLAVLAAAHAGDASPTEYRIAVTDLLEGERLLEIRHEGQTIHQWREREGVLAAPTELAGLSLLTLRDWIARLQGGRRRQPDCCSGRVLSDTAAPWGWRRGTLRSFNGQAAIPCSQSMPSTQRPWHRTSTSASAIASL